MFDVTDQIIAMFTHYFTLALKMELMLVGLDILVENDARALPCLRIWRMESLISVGALCPMILV